MRRAKIDNGVILLAVIVLIVVGLSIFLYFQVRTDKVTSLLDDKKEIRVLFIVASGDKPLFSEVFDYNPVTHRGALFDVPGNIGSIIQPLNRIDRIDILYKKDHVDEFRKKVESLLNLNIPFFWVMSPQQVQEITDLLGGLELFIPDAVQNVTDTSMTLLPGGNVTLGGNKIDTYLQYSGPNDRELDRFERERKFLPAFLKRLGTEAPFLAKDHVMSYLTERVYTNLDGRAMGAFIREMGKLNDSLISQRVLGDLKSVEGTTSNEKLLFPYFEGQLLKDAVRQVENSLSSKDLAQTDVNSINLQILYGTKISGLAAKTKELYQSYGFENITVGNADSNDVAKTEVIDRKGDPAVAQRVADVIKAKNVVTQATGVSDFNIDVTVILGNDFDGWYVR